jgi:hypothetical protein
VEGGPGWRSRVSGHSFEGRTFALVPSYYSALLPGCHEGSSSTHYVCIAMMLCLIAGPQQ